MFLSVKESTLFFPFFLSFIPLLGGSRAKWLFTDTYQWLPFIILNLCKGSNWTFETWRACLVVSRSSPFTSYWVGSIDFLLYIICAFSRLSGCSQTLVILNLCQDSNWTFQILTNMFGHFWVFAIYLVMSWSIDFLYYLCLFQVYCIIPFQTELPSLFEKVLVGYLTLALIWVGSKMALLFLSRITFFFLAREMYKLVLVPD